MSRIVNETDAFTLEQRREILSHYFEALARWERADLRGEADEASIQTISDLWDEYKAKTPVIRVAVNPFTGESFDHTIDVLGLDGLWWNYRNPTRRSEALPPTVLAFTGALRLSQPVEPAPFLCKPGPGLPFIVPRVLEQEGVRAVLAGISVGAHMGYAVVYFAEQEMRSYEGFNTWGTDSSSFAYDEYDYGWNTWEARPEDYCFDLRRWVESGKLLWIAPDDSEPTIHTVTAGCPYLDLAGERMLQVIQDGEVWTEQPWYVEEPPEMVGFEEAEAITTPAAEPLAQDSPSVAKFCRQCGFAVRPGAAFCPSCGAKL